jgi:MFS family permease
VAWAADRWSRRNIIAIGFLFWSAMTALTGFVADIWQLAITRFLMGAGEACGLAPSNSMIADLFRPARRPLALSLFGTAFAISSIIYFPIAGWITEAYGWRAAFVAAGVPGALLAILFFVTVKEPGRGASEARKVDAANVSFLATLRFMGGARTYLLLLAGVTFMGADVYAAGRGTPPCWSGCMVSRFMRSQPSSDRFAGTLWSPPGVMLGGILTDRLGRKNPRWRLYVPGLACLGVVPADLAFLLGDSRIVWIGRLCDLEPPHASCIRVRSTPP